MSKLKARKPEEVEVGHAKMLLFGKPGAGKSWFAMNFPKVYYFDCEAGSTRPEYQNKLLKAGGVYFGKEEGSNDFETVIEEVKVLATEKHDFRSVVFDSISKLYNTAIAKEQERLGDRDAFGASKKGPIAQMRRLLSWIDKLSMNAIFIAHSIPEWGQVNGQRQEIGETGDCYPKLFYELDLAMKVEQPSLMLRTATVTKSRLASFPQGERIILMDQTNDVGYSNFSKLWGKEQLEKPATPIVLCSAEQVSEIERLLKLLNIDEKEVDKIMTKANAEEFKDLTEAQASAFIQWLINKTQKEK